VDHECTAEHMMVGGQWKGGESQSGGRVCHGCGVKLGCSGGCGKRTSNNDIV
jgi:hypothetical protein